MFYGATSFNQPIGNWDVSNVTDMSYMFHGATSFNQSIDNWDVSNVTNMGYMFYQAESFNQPIGSWNVSIVINMYFMFYGTNYSSSNYDNLLQGWSQLTLQPGVVFDIPNTNFCTSTEARQLIIDNFGWIISDEGYESCFTPITDTNFKEAINTCLSTNPIDGMCSDSEYGVMPNWDVSQVTDMSNAFQDRDNFNVDISYWDVSNVNSMRQTFKGANSFNKDISNWNTSSVNNFYGMFSSASSFNQDIGSWDVSSATNMSELFRLAISFNQDLNTWDVSNVTTFSGTFAQSSVFNGDISSWNVSNCSNFGGMFYDNPAFAGDTSLWNVTTAQDMSSMFHGAVNFNSDISSWNVSSVTTMSRMFQGATIFNKSLNNWNVSNVSNMHRIFMHARSFNQNLNNWDISNATDVIGLFDGAHAFNGNVDTWIFGNVDIGSMFYDTPAFNQDISNWDVSEVIGMDGLFNGSSFNQDISGWCVTNISSEPSNFSANSPLTESNKPVWGTCPVNLVDTTVPVITLEGESTVTLEVGSTYSDAGATALDNYDGDITSSIVTVNTVDTSTVGTYIVTYDVSDANNNDAVQVIRTVNVVDTTLPVITITGDATVTIEVGSTYTDVGATALDNYDGDITSSIVTVNNVDTSVVGTYTITYNVSDANDNTAAEVIRTVNVVDTTLPVITITGDATVTIEVGSTYTDVGATALDNYDGDITSSIVTVNNVDTSVVGTYTITYNVSDANDNTAAEVIRTVNVESSLSIEENTNYKLKVYPNPVDDKLTIQGLQKEVKVSIYSVLGKLVLSKTTLSEIDVYNLKSGIYIIKFENNQKVVTRRFIKN
jgi:surface protein